MSDFQATTFKIQNVNTPTFQNSKLSKSQHLKHAKVQDVKFQNFKNGTRSVHRFHDLGFPDIPIICLKMKCICATSASNKGAKVQQFVEIRAFPNMQLFSRK